MTSAEKAAKAKEILNSNPSAEDKSIALGLAQEAAAENDHEGLYIMARLYHEGIGVEQNVEKSFDLCQKALAAGSEKVKTLLAIYYTVGNVVDRNIPLAEQYLRDGVAQNDGFAYFIMGDFVFQGVFLDIEWATFADYFQKAIEAGESGVMVRLAEKYNLICEPDKAEYWYCKAEESGVAGVVESRAQFTEDNYSERRHNILAFYVSRNKYDEAIALVDRDAAMGDITARYLQAAQYAQGIGGEAYGRNLQKGLAFYEQLSDEGDSHANFVLGIIYYTFDEIKDQQKALHYMQKAADADNPDALFVLAANYLNDPEIKTVPQYDFNFEKDENLGMLLLQKAAEADSHQALFSMSLCYSFGKYLEQDDEQAFVLLEQSVECEATADKVQKLADMYKDGKGVELDYQKAVACYQWATDNGSFVAASRLASMYKEGKGVEQNDEMANMLAMRSYELMQWQLFDIMPLEIAISEAEKGNPSAMFQLGGRYHKGEGVEPDMQKAIEWWQKAAEKGHTDSQWNLASIYHDGTLVDKDFDKARYWLEKGLEADSPAAHYGMAYSLFYGDMYEQNLVKALKHFRKAVEGGYHDADRGYIDMRWFGNGAEMNREEVISTYKDLAENSDAIAMYNLYTFYYDDTYDGHDNNLAAKYLKQSADAGYIEAIVTLGQQLLDDELFPEDKDAAFNYFAQAADQGNMEAQAWLGYCLEFGFGTDKDVNKAIELFTVAAGTGVTLAIYNLAMLYMVGEEGILEPDYDKAIATLQPYLEYNDDQIYYLMALALHCKCGMQNAYNWELASQAFEYMKKAAEAGHVGAMNLLSYWCLRGEGVMADDDESKKWVSKCLDNGGNITDEYYPEWYSDENFDSYSAYSKEMYLKELVETNIDRIENVLVMEDSEGNLELWNIMLNASQIGEPNAILVLGHAGMELLKTEPVRAKTYITAACKGEIPHFAYNAGMEWLEDGLDNDAAVEHAMEYFAIGVEHGSVDCALQIGLYCTDKRFEDEKDYAEAMKIGMQFLQTVSNVVGDEFDEQRQQARARLSEIEQRPKSAWGKIKKGLGSMLRKKNK